MNKFAILGLGSAALFTASAASAAPIFDENFEGPPPYQVTLTGNAQVLQGSNYVPCCGVTGTPAELANHFVSFGSGNAPSGVAIRDIATIIGQTYTVMFDYGALSGQNGSNDPLTVSGGAFSQTFNTSSNNNLGMTFSPGVFTFVATSTSSTLSFTSPGVLNVDAVLDNIAVSGAVPEPATWALMILGFGAIGGMMRRRQARTTVSYA